MTSYGKHSPSSTVTSCDHSTAMVAVNRVAADIKQRWNRGESPDLVSLLATNPELKANRSIFLDLAHDEFYRRISAGESIDTDEFCRQFPSFQDSLCMLIEVNRLFRQDPQFQSLCDETIWPKLDESFLGYLLIAEIGRGSFARVYLASEPALGGRLVVLKVAPQGAAEAEVAGKLRHPNIVPIHSIKEDSKTGLTAICMPYLGRTTLCDVLDIAYDQGSPPTDGRIIGDTIALQNGEVDTLELDHLDPAMHQGSYIESVLNLVIQIADALAYTHAQGICHRDLKPSNVLLSVEGHPLLLDFNLSADENTDVWRVGGTLPYMAPEQLNSVVHSKEGRAVSSDPRSDIFSLGVIIYQLLSGSLPFGRIPQGSSVEEVAEKLLQTYEAGVRSPSEHNKQIDRHLDNLVRSCLAFDPDNRPQSASDLGDLLRRQLTPVRRARRWACNHPRSMVSFVVLAFVFLAAGSAFLALRDPYSIRQFNEGMSYAEQGQYEAAIRCLDKSIDAEPRNAEVLFTRGRVRQKLGLYDAAAVDFNQAWKLDPRKELNVCQGYCASKLDSHRLAKFHYLKAREAGFQSAGLLNNLGYGFIRLKCYDDAERYLKEAIDMAPDFQAAHNNLLALDLQRAIQGEPITKAMLDRTRRTVEAAPPSGELYCYAATLFGKVSEQDSCWTKATKKYLRLAILNHADPRAITSDPRLSRLCKEDPEIRGLFEKSTVAEQSAKPTFLVDPLVSDSPIWSLERSSR